ncbi:uncharacterized protein CTHT_0065610 [Thermochaetoides thermophila DSM 1495]|uniref:Uncharacterized protein n=1 Tax=Chaetomium thermophilum (strain DSM 1495 / CBS 144.50 / IMI 039719) TaxID=759272 RepID=G0SGA3_CHATD|nr:hypothetical protein CTHT_0065610 [Thermochaetoides thermophila DSM 1495]EGS17242.1 hypothetical protein CTHT_0065610 [Thermochaetoides thermophila DSM 1495]
MAQRAPKFPSRPVAQLVGSNGPVHALTYSASPSTYILSGSSDRSIRLYNPTNATLPPLSSSSYVTKSTSSTPSIPISTPIQTYTSHAYAVLSIAVSRSNAHFVSSGGDRAVLLWDVSTAQTIRRFGASSIAHSHTGRVNAVLFAGDTVENQNDAVAENMVVSAGVDATVRLWDVRSSNPKPIQILTEARDAVTCLAVHGPAILAGSVDGRLRTYDVRMGKCIADTMPAAVTSVCVSRDGRTVLVGTLDSKMRVLDRGEGTCLRTFPGQNGGEDGAWRNEELRVQSVFGGGERWVVVGDEMTGAGEVNFSNGEGRVWAWDLLTGKLVAKVNVPWGAGETGKKAIGRDGREKERKNVVSCIAWKESGFGDQFCVGGTSSVVTVFGER